ncbi:hypothetical protein NPIL_236221 [Nephila pilipes]|uniref:Uncharacterized protein n=1 Tax=Nephila pilipes TaxID=299642 RepID=A0A8X6TD96_NEPPI|nr:hypothetical protein NPIL_236221 [Nephila pilipes]
MVGGNRVSKEQPSVNYEPALAQNIACSEFQSLHRVVSACLRCSSQPYPSHVSSCHKCRQFQPSSDPCCRGAESQIVVKEACPALEFRTHRSRPGFASPGSAHFRCPER